MLQKLNRIGKTNHTDQILTFLSNDEFIVTHIKKNVSLKNDPSILKML